MNLQNINFSFNKVSITLFLIICIGSVIISPVNGYLLPKTSLEKYLEHDIIVFGKILSLEEHDDTNSTPLTSYQIEVIQPIKGKIQAEQIWGIGLGAKNSSKHLDNETIFPEGQKGIFMLNKKSDATLRISPYTTSSDSQNPDSEFILPPLKLFKAGIASEEIHCKSYLMFGLKSSNLHPVCLKPNSFSKLMERQWIK